MSRAFFSCGSANRGLPTYAGKVLCVLIAVAFGTSLAQADPLPPSLMIDNWDNVFPGTITAANGPVVQTGITSSPYFGGVTRTATVANNGPGTSSATIVPNVLNFYLQGGTGNSLTLEYQFASNSVSFNNRYLSAFFANRNTLVADYYEVLISYEVFGTTSWTDIATVTIPGNEPNLEAYQVSFFNVPAMIGGIRLIYSSPFITDGSLCEVADSVPEIDPATGSSALSLVAGVLAMIEQRRRRVALVA